METHRARHDRGGDGRVRARNKEHGRGDWSFSFFINTCAEKLMVALRDGRKLIGVLRSWDQFGEFSAEPLQPSLSVTWPSSYPE